MNIRTILFYTLCITHYVSASDFSKWLTTCTPTCAATYCSIGSVTTACGALAQRCPAYDPDYPSNIWDGYFYANAALEHTEPCITACGEYAPATGVLCCFAPLALWLASPCFTQEEKND